MERRKFLFTIPAIGLLTKSPPPLETVTLGLPPVSFPPPLQPIGPGWHEAIISGVTERVSKAGVPYFVIKHKLMDSPGEVALNISQAAPQHALSFLRACGIDFEDGEAKDVDLESLVGSRVILRTKQEKVGEVEYSRVVDCRRKA